LLALRAGNGYSVLLYAKPGHVPAEHTVLNFPVEDIEATVDRVHDAGVEFERYDEGPIKTNEKGIATPGPKQAWFRDPAGNILSVLQD
jgi:predicted enzyme related to lactoylglutathione lyase